MKNILVAGLIILSGFLLINTPLVKAHENSMMENEKIVNKEQDFHHNVMERKGVCPMMEGYNGSMMAGFGTLGGLTWIAFIVFLLAGSYFFIKQAQKK